MVLLSHHIYCEFRFFLGSLEPFLIGFLETATATTPQLIACG